MMAKPFKNGFSEEPHPTIGMRLAMGKQEDTDDCLTLQNGEEPTT